MRPTVVTALASTAALAAAQANVAEYYWSYPPANYTITAPHGYDPAFAVCGNTCEACEKDAKECFSLQYSNTCYEPKKGEHCCRDLYGTACVQGYYCAYNGTQAGYCCADGTSLEDCGVLFNQTLTSTEVNIPSTIIVTQVMTSTKTPASTASSASTGSSSTSTDSSTREAKPTDSPKPLDTITQKPTTETGLPTGAKVGIAVAAVAFVGLVAAALTFLILRRKRGATKYAPPPTAGQHIPPPGVAAFAPPPPYGAREMAYEPMRTADASSSEYYKPSPEPSPRPSSAVPYRDSASPAPERRGAPLAEMAGRPVEVHEMPGVDGSRQM